MLWKVHKKNSSFNTISRNHENMIKIMTAVSSIKCEQNTLNENNNNETILSKSLPNGRKVEINFNPPLETYHVVFER